MFGGLLEVGIDNQSVPGYHPLEFIQAIGFIPAADSAAYYFY